MQKTPMWDDTLQRFAAHPAGFAFLAACRALARPAHELLTACADLYSSLSRNDLPTGSAMELRKACRELRHRGPSDFDAAWRDLAGELPAWLLIEPAFIQEVLGWISTPTWRESCDYLRGHAGTLLSDAVQPVFDELELNAPDDPKLQQYRALLSVAQQYGIDITYRPLLLREVVNTWISTDTWTRLPGFS